MIDVIKRVKALIAKAAHPDTPDIEARTCALMACRLIQKENIELSINRHIPLFERDHGSSDEWDDVIPIPSTCPNCGRNKSRNHPVCNECKE